MVFLSLILFVLLVKNIWGFQLAFSYPWVILPGLRASYSCQVGYCLLPCATFLQWLEMCWQQAAEIDILWESTSSLASLTQLSGPWVSGTDHCAWPGSESTLDPTRLPQVQKSKVWWLLSAKAHQTGHIFFFSHLLFTQVLSFFFQNRLLPTLHFENQPFLQYWGKYNLYEGSPDCPLVNMSSLDC